MISEANVKDVCQPRKGYKARIGTIHSTDAGTLSISLRSNRRQPKRLSNDDIERVFQYVPLHRRRHEVCDGKASGDAPPDIG